MNTRDYATIGDLLRVAFPQGTEKSYKELGLEDVLKSAGKWPCPVFPPDLFGFAATLLNWSGAYSLFCPGGDCHPDSPYSHELPQNQVDAVVSAGREWGETLVNIPDQIVNLWDALIAARTERIYFTPKSPSDLPDWCTQAALLMIAADEASYGVGRFAQDDVRVSGEKISFADAVVHFKEEEALEAARKKANGKTLNEAIEKPVQRKSIALSFNPDVACVQPKCKTSYVGCTLRAVSQHLALLPHRGEMRVQWLRPPSDDLGAAAQGLNVLLIPFPYEIAPESVKPNSSPSGQTNSAGWQWFELEQRWLPSTEEEFEAIKLFVRELIEAAKPTNGHVQAVVFPELSLDWKTYSALLDMFVSEFPHIEVFVSGSSDNCEGDKGNYVLSANLYSVVLDGGKTASRKATVTSRPKHHRWRVERRQIEQYGWEARLDPALLWWEKIPIPPRELHSHVFREGSSFTTLICEDLARSEPCHEVLRAVGPNIVFALLMDGVQTPDRWAARYSTGLADDPGSSVLTFTSRALIAATYSKRTDKKKRDWSIALWKDDESPPTPIRCRPSFHATAIRLHALEVPETSMDGRTAKKCWAWRMQGSTATEIKLDRQGNKALGAAINLFTKAR